LKTVRIDGSEKRDGTPITAIREISLLRSLRHPNIVNVIEVAIGGKPYDPPVRPLALFEGQELTDRYWLWNIASRFIFLLVL
jgi:hypothetical protein